MNVTMATTRRAYTLIGQKVLHTERLFLRLEEDLGWRRKNGFSIDSTLLW